MRADSATPTRGAARFLWSVPVRMLELNIVTNLAMGLVAVLSSRALGPEGRGTLVLHLTVASVVVILCGFGTNTAARYLLIAGEEDERVELGQFLGLSSVLVLAATLTGWVGSSLLLPVVDPAASLTDAALTGVFAGASLASLQLTDSLHGQGRHIAAVGTTTLGALGALGGAAALQAGPAPDPAAYLAVLAGSMVLQVLVALALIARGGVRYRPAIAPGAWRRLLAMGRSGLVLNASQSLAFRADRYLIGLLLGPGPVGVYSVAATLPELVRLVPYSLSEIVFRRSAADPTYSIERHRQLRTRCLAIVAGVGAVAAASAPVVVPAVFTDEFTGAVAPLTVLLIAELAIGSFYLDARRLSGRGHISRAARAATVGLAVVLLADVALIPSFELVGAAIASVAGYGTMAIMARRAVHALG